MKLNIGCGNQKIEGWVNVDVSSEKDADVVADVRDGLPFDDNSVDFIYSEHFIEHLTLEEARLFSDECYRLLKPKGVVRVATIDLKFIIQKYLNEWGGQKWLEDHPEVFSKGSMMNACFYWWRHRYIYDIDDMVSVFSQFSMSRESFGESHRKELCNLETRTESTLVCDFLKVVIPYA